MPDDQILVDRGFTLQDDFATICSAELIILSFTKVKLQLSDMEVETSQCLPQSVQRKVCVTRMGPRRTRHRNERKVKIIKYT